jgi:hypothetical protein
MKTIKNEYVSIIADGSMPNGWEEKEEKGKFGYENDTAAIKTIKHHVKIWNKSERRKDDQRKILKIFFRETIITNRIIHE